MSAPLTDKINALTALANETTGESDNTLTDAINTLIAGYGGGRGIELWKTIVLEEDHIEPSIANPVYWFEYIGNNTPQRDFAASGEIWFCDFQNSGYPDTYYARFALYYGESGSVRFAGLRTSSTGVFSNFARSYNLFACAGTTIKVYRIAEDNIELYPIGEDVVSRYIGRDWSNASVPMVRGRVNHETGLYEPDENGDYNISLIYIPVSPNYQYTKSGSSGFLYRVLFYDEEKNFISGVRFTPNWNIWFSFTPPAGARYMRIATHTSDQYKNVYVFRSA